MLMFGASAYNVARQAKPFAIAAREYPYEYRAPESCGSGLIRIQFYKESATWDPIAVLSRNMNPDVLIGLNAGMSTFDKWHPVFSASRALSIPFAITEFCRLCLTQDRVNYKKWVVEAIADSRLGHELLGHEKLRVLVKSLDHQPSVELNPFMRPGNIGMLTNRTPNGFNGFSCIVTPRVQAE